MNLLNMSKSGYEFEHNQKRRWAHAARLVNSGDKAGGLFLLLKLASDGVSEAYVEIGKIYEVAGGGITKDFQKALYWYRKAAFEEDDVRGYLALGRMYYQGKGVAVNYKEAFRFYSLAVLNDKPVAYLMLARMYWLGRGVDVDVDYAIENYKNAVRLGNVIALQELGFVYRRSGRYLYGMCLGAIASVKILWIGMRNMNNPRLEQI